MGLSNVMPLINNCGRFLILLALFTNFTSIVFAQQELADALSQLCHAATTFLAASIMIMIILSAAVYAIGQIMGAETRARASVWATAMLTGAIIAVIIYFLTPLILQTLLQGSGITIDPNDPCNFQGGGGGGGGGGEGTIPQPRIPRTPIIPP